MTDRYHYEDFEEYCTITDTEKYPKTITDFYSELVEEGYLEDYDGDKEIVLDLATEKYNEYLCDHCMYGKEIVAELNKQEQRITGLKKENASLSEKINDLECENEKLRMENHRLNSKVKSQMEELAICYEKLGW